MLSTIKINAEKFEFKLYGLLWTRVHKFSLWFSELYFGHALPSQLYNLSVLPLKCCSIIHKQEANFVLGNAVFNTLI